MVAKENKYQFMAIPWRYTGPAGWIFVSLPVSLSQKIREAQKDEEQGWGRLQVTAIIGNTNWKTAIWYDTNRNTYLLPLKAEIRKKESILPENEIAITLWI